MEPPAVRALGCGAAWGCGRFTGPSSRCPASFHWGVQLRRAPDWGTPLCTPSRLPSPAVRVGKQPPFSGTGFFIHKTGDKRVHMPLLGRLLGRVGTVSAAMCREHSHRLLSTSAQEPRCPGTPCGKSRQRPSTSDTGRGDAAGVTTLQYSKREQACEARCRPPEALAASCPPLLPGQATHDAYQGVHWDDSVWASMWVVAPPGAHRGSPATAPTSPTPPS